MVLVIDVGLDVGLDGLDVALDGLVIIFFIFI